jgi:hypothetical protein
MREKEDALKHDSQGDHLFRFMEALDILQKIRRMAWYCSLPIRRRPSSFVLAAAVVVEY